MFQIKYRNEIQFLLCFIWHLVNPIETETEPETEMGLVTFGSSPFHSVLSINTRAKPSKKTTNRYSPFVVSGQ